MNGDDLIDVRSPDPSSVATPQDFGRELSVLRERARLSIREVARRTGLTVSTAGGYFAGRHLPTLALLHVVEDIVRTCGVSDRHEVDAWVEAVRRARRAPGPRPAGACAPYRGLQTFGPQDRDWFFGRETITAELLARIEAAEAAGGGLVTLVGVSGAGKSSLLRAGVIPRCQSWDVRLLTPGTQPLERLARASAPAVDRDEVLRHEIAVDEVLDVAAVGVAPGGSGEVIVVDQFEELFTLCEIPLERERFVEALLARAAAGAVLLLGIRADFYHRLLDFPRMMSVLPDSQVLLGEMTAEDLRRAITEPARRANIDLEDGLVEVLLSDLAPRHAVDRADAHDPGGLPLLSHTLLQMWTRRHGSRLTVRDYRAGGGLRQSIATTAELVHGELSEEERHVARRLFLRLVVVSEGMGATRRRMRYRDLPTAASRSAGPGAPTSADPSGPVPTPELRRVLDRFVEARLLTVGLDGIEITHEILLVAWPRLREWLETGRDEFRVHRLLEESAGAWEQSGEDPSALLRGLRLESVQSLARELGPSGGLATHERRFLAASVAARDHERQIELRRTRRLQRLVALLVVAVLAASGLSAYAFQLRSTTARERDEALSRQLAGTADRVRSSDTTVAARLALAAYSVSQTAEARSSLMATSADPLATRLPQAPGGTTTIAVSPDGAFLAGAGETGSVRIWSRHQDGTYTSRHDLPTDHPEPFYSIVYSSDGRYLAAAGSGGTIVLWQLFAGRPPVRLPRLTGAAGTVYSLAFGAGGTVLVSGGAGGEVRLWDVGDAARAQAGTLVPVRLSGPTKDVKTVAFSPDGRTLAAGGVDRSIYRWNLLPDERLRAQARIEVLDGDVLALAFAPDGRSLAAGGKGGVLHRWEIAADGTVGHDTHLSITLGFVYSLAFGPDGRTVITGSSDSAGQVWNLDRGVVTQRLAHPGPVTGVVLDGDGEIITSSRDGTARLWPGQRSPGEGLNGQIVSSAVATRAGLLVAADDDEIALWSTADTPSEQSPSEQSSSSRSSAQLGPTFRPTNYAAESRSITSILISTDGALLAAGSRDGAITLWDLADPTRPQEIFSGPGGKVMIEAMAFTAGAKILATANDAGRIELWDVAEPRKALLLSTVQAGGMVLGMAVSPDGNVLATAGEDRTLRLWDIHDRSRPRALGSPVVAADHSLYGIAFSPDGRLLATSSVDRTVRLWRIENPAHPEPIGAPLAGPTNSVYAVAFSPDGRQLSAVSTDGSARGWDVTRPTAPQLAYVVHVPGALYSLVYSGDGRTIYTGGATPTMHAWRTGADDIRTRICARLGRDDLTAAERRQYAPGPEPPATCAPDPA